MQKTLKFPSDEIYNPAEGMNCQWKGVPLKEVIRLKPIIREYLLADVETPYYLTYEVNEGDILYDYPTHITPEERKRFEKHGW